MHIYFNLLYLSWKFLPYGDYQFLFWKAQKPCLFHSLKLMWHFIIALSLQGKQTPSAPFQQRICKLKRHAFPLRPGPHLRFLACCTFVKKHVSHLQRFSTMSSEAGVELEEMEENLWKIMYMLTSSSLDKLCSHLNQSKIPNIIFIQLVGHEKSMVFIELFDSNSKSIGFQNQNQTHAP